VIGNISLLIISLLVIGIITVYLYKKWPNLDIIDLYIVFVLLHFGFVPFTRGLYFGKDIVFDFRYSHPLLLALVFAHILLILLILRVSSYFFPSKLSNSLKVRYLIEQCGYANKYILILAYTCLVLFPIISYFIYGVKPYILPDDFEKIGKSLPYWFTSFRTIYNYIAFWVFLGLFGNIVKSRKCPQLFWSILTVILILSITIYGRRFLVNMIVVWVIFWLVYHKKSIFRLRYVTISLLLVGVLFIFSNIYQTYRNNFLFKEGQINVNKLENPFLAALNYHSTIHNFKIRAGTWEFNFLVFDQQINKSKMTTNGKLMGDAFKSSIPRFFWPEKQFTLIDDYLTDFFMVRKRDVNIAKNIFGIAQLDFGYYSIIIVPAILLLIIAIYGVGVEKMFDYPTFMILFAGNIIWYLINFEANGNEIFFMLRNIVIIVLLFTVCILACKFYNILYNYKINKYLI